MGLRTSKAESAANRAQERPRSRSAVALRQEVLADFDTQLMLQVRSGDADAANRLVRRNYDRVARYILRVVRETRYVEDVSQEVFLQVLTHAEKYEPTAKFSTWLYRIATNTALKHVSQAYIRRRAPDRLDGVGDVPDRSQTGPDRRMDLDELKGRLSQSISRLPIKQRVALILFEYEELSYEQIASVLEVTVEAVRSLLMRARTTLRRNLSGLI